MVHIQMKLNKISKEELPFDDELYYCPKVPEINPSRVKTQSHGQYRALICARMFQNKLRLLRIASCNSRIYIISH